MRLPRMVPRLEVAAVVALGLAAAVGTAAPAHADVTVTCASISADGGSVFGFLCTGATNAPQRGTIADRVHAYSCIFITLSELGSEATGDGCTLIR
jgi:hypothetical protein